MSRRRQSGRTASDRVTAKILKINPKKIGHARLRPVADAIRKGKLVIFPTETIYGIGANALDAKAVRGIYRAKGRPSKNPLIVHVDSMRMAKEMGDIPKKYESRIAKAWPGAVTFVVKVRKIVPRVVTGGLETVAIRMPEDRLTRELVSMSGVPIAAPSANMHGRPSPTSARHVIGDFKSKVAFIVDAGRSKYGVESTIVDLSTFTLLRPGAFPVEDIERIFKMRLNVPEQARGTRDSRKALSPGMKYKHYAPSTPLFLFTGKPDTIGRLVKGIDANIAFLGSSETCMRIGGRMITIPLGSRSDLREIAHNLFDRLRFLDSLGVDFVIAESFSEKGMGLAVMNRLRRASQHLEFRTRKGLLDLKRLSQL